ncbi:MAG: hypothetical protein AB1730_21520 [Myxococcota bacterium]|jgi:hypothetical protein
MLRGLAAALYALLVSGCGSLCDRAEASAKSFTEKAAPCGATNPNPRFDRMACEASMGACSPADVRALGTYLDCLDALPTCQPAKSTAFSTAVLECAAPMTTLADGCFVQ